MTKKRKDGSVATGLADIAMRVSDRTGFQHAAVFDILKTAFEEVKHCLDADEEVYIARFGKLYVTTIPERGGVNPKTREPVIKPQVRTLRIKPSKVLKEFLNPDD